MIRFIARLLTVSMLVGGMAACGPDGVESPARTSRVASEAAPAPPSDPGLGISLPKPEGWYQLSTNESDSMYDLGSTIVSGDDANMKALTQAAKARARNLFSYFRHPLGAPVDFNPSVTVAIENLAMAPGVKDGVDYFFHMRKMLLSTSLDVRVVKEPEIYTLDGQTFHRAELEMTMMGNLLHQAIYLARHGEDMVIVIQHWMTEEDRQMTQAVVDSIKLDW
jgi:hypothetical protein